VVFRVNLNSKRKDKSFLSFQRKDKSLQQLQWFHLNHRVTKTASAKTSASSCSPDARPRNTCSTNTPPSGWVAASTNTTQYPTQQRKQQLRQ